MPFLKINDVNLYYEIQGQGKPVVLISGLGAGMSLFLSTIKVLSPKFKILAFDNRGVGKSDKPDVPYSMEMMADDTAGLMGELGFSPASVVGISMGGRIALALALNHPEMVTSLVLASTAARVDVEARNKTMGVRVGRLVNRVTGSGLFGKSAQPYYAFKRQLAASGGYDATGRLGEISVPALIMNGRRDKIAPQRSVEDMHSRIKGSEVQTFPGGHMFFLFHNKEFSDSVASFLGGVG